MANIKTILIIEDDPKIRLMLNELFNEHGYRVTDCDNGKTAISMVYKYKPDLIILDILLPDLDGFSLCKLLKMDLGTNSIPIIMLSALNSHHDISYGLKIGADAFVTKPFNIAQLTEKVDDLISHKEKSKGQILEVINFTLNSELEHLNQLNTLISISLNRSQLTSQEIEEVKAGIYEIVANAIEWGNKFRSELLVEVVYTLLAGHLIISVKDEGKGFECDNYIRKGYIPFDFQDDRLKQGKRLGGFGIKMTQSYFDELSYDRADKKVVLKKKLIQSHKYN